MTVKKIISIIITASLILSLAACSNGGEQDSGLSSDSNNTTSPSSSTSANQTLADELGFGYVAEYAKIPYEFNYISKMFYYDGRVYMTINVEDKETLIYSTKLISMLPDCTDLQEHALPEISENADIRNIAIDSEGNILMDVYEYIYRSSGAMASTTGVFFSEAGSSGTVIVTNAMAPVAVSGSSASGGGSVGYSSVVVSDDSDDSDDSGDEDTSADVNSSDGEYEDIDEENYETYDQTYRLLKCDTEGNVIAEIDILEEIAPAGSEYFYINNLVIDKNNNIYLASSGMESAAIYVLDSDMKPLFTLDNLGYFVRSMIPYEDTVIVSYYGENGFTQAPVDLATSSFGTPITLPESYSYRYQLLIGQGGQNYLYDDSYLYTYDMTTSKMEPLLNWIDCDINSNYTDTLIAVSDELFICNYYDQTLGTSEIMTLNRIPASEIPKKDIITYACVYLDYDHRDAIISFNRTNDTYRITINDYSRYVTSDDYMAGYTQLNNDLLAGQMPDLLNLSGLYISNYTNKGLLEDLYPYIDSDFGRDYFVDGLLGAIEDSDGKLYHIGSTFYISTLAGLSSVVGDGAGWTVDDMIAAYKSMPEGAQLMNWMTKASFLETFLQNSLSDYVNYETGECKFDSQQFISLLEMANTFPTDYDSYYNEDGEYDDEALMMKNGQLMLTSVYFNGFSNLDYYNAYYGSMDLSYKGYPSSSGSGHVLGLNSIIAICSASQKKDGAWEFLKLLLGDDYQTAQDWTFPVQKAAFEASAESAMEPNYYLDENGEKVEYENTWNINGVEYVVPPATQEQIDEIKAMINSVDKIQSYRSDDTMMSIINEETEAFFAGNKTAQDVANLIQNRVRTYVMENM